MQNKSTKNLYLQKKKVMPVLLLGFALTLITWKVCMYCLVFCIADTMQWCIVVDVSIYKTNDEHNKVKGFLKSHFTPPTLDSGIDVFPTFINLRFFFRPYCLIKEGKRTFLCKVWVLIQGPMFILFAKFSRSLKYVQRIATRK